MFGKRSYEVEPRKIEIHIAVLTSALRVSVRGESREIARAVVSTISTVSGVALASVAVIIRSKAVRLVSLVLLHKFLSTDNLAVNILDGFCLAEISEDGSACRL